MSMPIETGTIYAAQYALDYSFGLPEPRITFDGGVMRMIWSFGPVDNEQRLSFIIGYAEDAMAWDLHYYRTRNGRRESEVYEDKCGMAKLRRVFQLMRQRSMGGLS